MDANPDKFKVLKVKNSNSLSRYAKDPRTVFYTQIALLDADPKTFTVRNFNGHVLGTDKKYVYSDSASGRSFILKGIDPDKVEVEINKNQGTAVISDGDTNFYWKTSCDGGVFVPEDPMFEYLNSNWGGEWDNSRQQSPCGYQPIC